MVMQRGCATTRFHQSNISRTLCQEARLHQGIGKDDELDVATILEQINERSWHARFFSISFNLWLYEEEVEFDFTKAAWNRISFHT